MTAPAIHRSAAGMYRAARNDFQGTVRQIADILAAIMPEVHELSDDETLTYLHGCVSTKRSDKRCGTARSYRTSSSGWRRTNAL